MKNKTVISFLVNILIGIIFSFPVFSSNISLEDYVNSDNEYVVSESNTETSSVSDLNFYAAINYGNHRLSDALPARLIKSNLTTCNKVNHFSDFTPTHLKNQHLGYFISDIQFTNILFVDLSYLKELKTTKMLC